MNLGSVHRSSFIVHRYNARRGPHEEFQSRRHPRGDAQDVGPRLRSELLGRAAAAGRDRRAADAGEFSGPSAPHAVSDGDDRHAHVARRSRADADAADERLGRPVVLDPDEDAFPRQRLLAARHVRHRPARHSRGHSDAGETGDAGRTAQYRQTEERHRPGHGADRLRQIDHAGGHHQSDQSRLRVPHHHHRRSGRVHAQAHQVDRQSARGRQRHEDLLARAARRAAAGAEGDPHRRDARRGDHRDRHGSGGDGPPRALHAAHHRRGEDHRPHRRRLLERPGAAGPHALLPVVPLRRLAAPAAEDRRRCWRS